MRAQDPEKKQASQQYVYQNNVRYDETPQSGGLVGKALQ